MSLVWPMGPVCSGYIPEPPRNQIPPLVGQNDLLEALQVKLGQGDLIRNILPMPWNRKVQLTSKYSWGMALHVYLKIRHNDLYLSKDCHVKIRNRSHWPIWCPKDLLTGMDLKSTPGHRNSIPLPFPFERRQDWNFSIISVAWRLREYIIQG